MQCEGEQHVLDGIPNLKRWLTIPANSMPASASLWEGMLMLEGHVKGDAPDAMGWVCSKCYWSLQGDSKFALTNNMWIGPILHQLAVLTLPKELLILCHFARCYIFKLYPKDTRRGRDPSHLQHGMAKNATLYDMNTNDMVKMIEGQLLPQPINTLASILAITYIGKRGLLKEWLKSTFRVCCAVVFNALKWLKANNPLYGNIQISQDLLAHLPEDEVPEEIILIVWHEVNDDIAVRESKGYVPNDHQNWDDGESPVVFTQIKSQITWYRVGQWHTRTREHLQWTKWQWRLGVKFFQCLSVVDINDVSQMRLLSHYIIWVSPTHNSANCH